MKTVVLRGVGNIKEIQHKTKCECVDKPHKRAYNVN